MKQKTQSGFAHMIIITIILGLAVVGLVGYVIWQNVSHTESTSETPTSKTSDKVVTSDETDSVGDYLVLGDWGVKFAVPEDTGSRTINYYKGVSTKADVYLFSTSEVENLGGTCAYSSDSYWSSLGSISRETEDNGISDNNTEGYQGKLIRKIGNYYYFYNDSITTNQGNCSETNIGMQTQDTALIKNLLDSIQAE